MYIPVKEKLISMAGGFLGIFAIFMVSQWLVGPSLAMMIAPSMGATAVLLFAAPHASFSQPWNVIVGHTLSAFAGVTCWMWIPEMTIAASAGVGLAIGIMFFTRSIHPPGGATALTAVIGAEELHQLGYDYIYQPVLLNVMTIILVAICINNLFKWRQYPAYLETRHKENKQTSQGTLQAAHQPISHEDFVYALSHIDTYVDIEEADLVKIYKLATQRQPGEDYNYASQERT